MHGADGCPRFFLLEPPVEGHLTLVGEEADHALRVLRLGPGARLEALDGAGVSWLAEVTGVSRRTVEARVLEGPTVAPAPGEAGAPLPWVEVAVAWPRKSRAEDMLGRLVQLGAAAIRPLRAEFSGEVPPPDEPPARWHKLAREAAKQSARRHLPRFEPPADLAAFARSVEGVATAVLDADAGLGLDQWLRSLEPQGEGRPGTRARPLRLVVGPEGGFSPAERDALLEAGASPTRLGPHVLRIETAAEAAMAVAATILGRGPA